MNKKKIALSITLVLLTGCSANNIKNSGDNSIAIRDTVENEESNKQEEDKDKEERSDTTNNEESKDQRHTHENEDMGKEDTKNTKKSEEEINNLEKMNIEEIFDAQIGASYIFTGPIDYEKREKLVNIRSDKRVQGTAYYFEGIDCSDMKDGTRKPYEYNYNVFRDNIILCKDNKRTLLFNKEAAEKDESWRAEFISQQVGEFEGNFKVIEWNENSLEIEIKPIEEMSLEEQVGYVEKYTFEKGKGLVSIDIKIPLEKGEIYPFSISIKELEPQVVRELEVQRWENIDNKFITEDSILKGYSDINDDYFEIIKNQMKDLLLTKDITKEEYSDIFKDYLGKMPDDSMNAVSHIGDIAMIMYEAAGDEYYITAGIGEYERRINTLNRIYEQDGTKLPIIDRGLDFLWTKDFMFRKPFYNPNYEGIDKRRLDIYLENFIRPTAIGDDIFACSTGFIDHINSKEYSPLVKSYLKYKEYDYSTSSTYNKVKNDKLLESIIIMEEKETSGDDRYSKYTNEMIIKLLEPETFGGMVSKKYVKKIDDYLSYGQEGKYNKSISEVKNIIEKSEGRYSEELNQYLKEFGVKYIDENGMKYIKDNYDQRIREREFYGRTKENYTELKEISENDAVEVWNAFELVSAIKDNAVIKVMDEIVIDLQRDTYISDKVDIWDGGLLLRGLKNVTIIGDGDYPVRISAGTTEAVMTLEECENITLRNISMGHINDYCNGPVLRAESSFGITVEDSIMYGCGVKGLDYQSVKNIAVRNTLIWDCSSIGISFLQVEGGYLNNVVLTENGSNKPFINGCTDIEEINVVVD